MLLRTHLVFATLVYLVFFKYLEISFAHKIFFGIFLFLATVFVDIDARKSKIGNHWFLRPLQWFISHRGMIHSLLFGFILSIIIFVIDNNSGVGFFIGYILHLVLDSFTSEGICFFWPFSSEKISILKISSGGLIEEIIFVLVLLFDIFYFVRFVV